MALCADNVYQNNTESGRGKLHEEYNFNKYLIENNNYLFFHIRFRIIEYKELDLAKYTCAHRSACTVLFTDLPLSTAVSADGLRHPARGRRMGDRPGHARRKSPAAPSQRGLPHGIPARLTSRSHPPVTLCDPAGATASPSR
jgi:hypothetical protein